MAFHKILEVYFKNVIGVQKSAFWSTKAFLTFLTTFFCLSGHFKIVRIKYLNFHSGIVFQVC